MRSINLLSKEDVDEIIEKKLGEKIRYLEIENTRLKHKLNDLEEYLKVKLR